MTDLSNERKAVLRAYRDLCVDCGAHVFGNTPPSPEYAQTSARILFVTGAVESDFRHNRQVGYSFEKKPGAWGIWQTEAPPLIDAQDYFARHEKYTQRAARWLLNNQRAIPFRFYTMQISVNGLLPFIAGWDRLACLYARVHYQRKPGAIPPDMDGMYDYYKLHYNTPEGKTTRDKWDEAWRRCRADSMFDSDWLEDK